MNLLLSGGRSLPPAAGRSAFAVPAQGGVAAAPGAGGLRKEELPMERGGVSGVGCLLGVKCLQKWGMWIFCAKLM